MESSIDFGDPFEEVPFGQEQDSLDFGDFSVPDNLEKASHSVEITNALDSTYIQQESNEEAKNSFVMSGGNSPSEMEEGENFLDTSEQCL